jgi:hypothetical protein
MVAYFDVLLVESPNTIKFSELGRKAGDERTDEIGESATYIEFQLDVTLE